jgi:predicted dehydrogenase
VFSQDRTAAQPESAASDRQCPRIAVVGAGYWGPNIIRNVLENSSCFLTAVCDRIPERLENMRSRLPKDVLLSTDYDEVLKDPTLDAVAVVTEINSHFELVRRALEAGKHVFVEKPLAASVEQCEKLGKLAQQQQKVLMVGHTFLYNPAVRKLKDIVESGTLGELFYLHAQRLNLGRIQTNINALWSLAVHDVAIALYLFGEQPTHVRAWGNAFITPNVEDVTFLNLQFPSGRLANIHASWLDPEKKRQVTLVGSKQMVVYDDVSLDRKITIYDKGFNKVLKDTETTEYKSFSEFQVLTRSGDISIPQLKFTEPLKIEIQHFVDCILGKVEQPITHWEAGRDVVQVLESAQQSLSQSGTPIEIEWGTHV